MVEKLNVYTLHVEPCESNTTIKLKRGYVHVVAGSPTEAIKTYLKSVSLVDESIITSVAIHLIGVLV